MQQPRAVLGIDAAWTDHEPSGVAVEDEAGGWRCAGVAPSYQAFEALSEGQAVDWNQAPASSAPRVVALAESARTLLSAGNAGPLTVTVDMPMATVPITGRRSADNLVAVRFGGQGCGTHSPARAGPVPSEKCSPGTSRRMEARGP
jgi:predicted RNase H-like nuclease